ncbi:MAG TPA: MMPL family transporter [Hanamia sp.]
MWQHLAKLVLKNRLILLICLLVATLIMAFFASRIQLSYEFNNAIPVDNPKYEDYLSFRKKFGDDGNVLVIGVQTKDFFQLKNFTAFQKLNNGLTKIPNVEDVLSVAKAVNLLKDTASQKLDAILIFPKEIKSQSQIDSSLKVLYTLPFYRSLLYNPNTNAYLIVLRINKEVLASQGRTKVISDIIDKSNEYTAATGVPSYISGLPLIRTQMADRVAHEMKWFVIGSLLLSALILLVMFRSVSTTILSLTVVVTGVIWSVGIMQILGFKITLLSALIPPLVVVIGIPNCIYFLNKYHSCYRKTGDKNQSLIDMVSKMGVVTLFCNITAAIGLAVFALTKSPILKEFGEVAGLSIMLVFVISFILLPGALSYMKVPGKKHLKYIDLKLITTSLLKIEHWVFNHKKTVYAITLLVIVFSILGMYQLKTEGFVVDDLPKTDKLSTDLRFFENNFDGVMPLEIVIDSKKRNGVAGSRILPVLAKMDSLSMYINAQGDMSRPLSIAEGIKFVKQGFYEGDSSNYALPNSFDMAFIGDYLHPKDDTGKNNLSKMLSSFIDTSLESTRMSIDMADVGTVKLPIILDSLKQRTDHLFDSSKYKVTFTGASITFLEGSAFIIHGLKESLLWAFLFIALCMLYLFKSFRILICSLIPNVIPLMVTAGIMGWVGVRLKPSTVLIFSLALGIAIDVTIRFLVNYKQELPTNNFDIKTTVSETIKHTGLSIIYTSLVLIAGFIIFCFSGFGGTQSLGWLTSVTLLTATLTNLILLPVLLLDTAKKKNKKIE